MKLLPLYLTGLFKSRSFRLNGRGVSGAGRVRADQRAAALVSAMCRHSAAIVCQAYPLLIPATDGEDGAGEDDGDEDSVDISATWNSAEKLHLNRVFILDLLERQYLHCGPQVPADVRTALFGTADKVDPRMLQLQPFPPPADVAAQQSKQARAVHSCVSEKLAAVRKRAALLVGHRNQPLHVVTADAADYEAEFFRLLVEDKVEREDSYVDLLCSIHKKIQNKMVD